MGPSFENFHLFMLVKLPRFLEMGTPLHHKKFKILFEVTLIFKTQKMILASGGFKQGMHIRIT